MSQQINLCNPLLLKRKNYLSAQTMALSLALLLAGALALALYGQSRLAALERQVAASTQALAAREARKAQIGATFAPRRKDPDIDAQLASAELERASLLQVQDILRRGEFGNTRGYSAYFRAFARSRVDGLWLTGVDIVGAGNAIGLRGRALAPALLPPYIGALAGQPVLKGKSFARLEIAPARPPEPPAANGAAASAPVAAAPAYLEFSLQAMPLEERK